jgi:hypothetical protein
MRQNGKLSRNRFHICRVRVYGGYEEQQTLYKFTRGATGIFRSHVVGEPTSKECEVQWGAPLLEEAA